ncbi:DUF3103 domain-containing protein [Marinilongibacter aquaticus]|uniref:DUF3103 domain-containing protein n=1 Tax=Marinilongibacter aquaticus TaxID=2975157 RepID=UPI0021BD3884|nr:DUF3103 domain-containing protein [Marinilongibacter aquaticus]UBM59417.1 DUF3103 domain-containing protein [Marinilongibacter aquaticus]
MKKQLIVHTLCIVCTLVISSCSDYSPEAERESYSPRQTILIPSTVQTYDASKFREINSEVVKDAEEFAKLVALSLKDRDFREFLKKEANKKFDDDYDILVSQVLYSKIGRETFETKICKKSESNFQKLNRAIRNKKLNISIPLWIENWDTDKNELLVAVSIGAKDGETEYLKAFDSDGNVYIIDAKVEPELPVLVVGNNERMGYKAKNKQTTSLRTSGGMEKVTWLKCPNLGTIEGWFDGAPEIRWEGVVYNSATNTAIQAFVNNENAPSRHHAKDGYTLSIWTSNQNLFHWYFDAHHGPEYYIQAFEIDDDGSSISMTTNIKDNSNVNHSYSINYKSGDYKLKGQLIHKSETTPVVIGDGLLQYRLEN